MNRPYLVESINKAGITRSAKLALRDRIYFNIKHQVE